LELEPVNASTVREWILHLEAMPCGRAYADADPNLWQVVRLGLEHVPTILELVNDPTETQMKVCLFGGSYTVGDVAVSAFSNIVRGAPVALFASAGDQKRIDSMGYGVYWQFVRESDSNRDAMKEYLEEWFENNRDRLVWVRQFESPAGGYYEIRNESQP